MRAPYIGITGFVTDDDIETARACASLVPASHAFMAGVLVSAKTLAGQRATNRRYPSIFEVPRLCGRLESYGVPILHYNSRSDALADEVERLMYAVPRACGVQLNVVAPDPALFDWYRRSYPDHWLILQVNQSSVRGGEGSRAERVLRYIDRYPGATHALLDMSGGRGELLDADLASEVLSGWRSDATPVLAGGLGPTCDAVLRRVVATRSFGIDAESRVRVPVDDPIAGERYQDRMHRELAVAYVRAATAALAR